MSLVHGNCTFIDSSFSELEGPFKLISLNFKAQNCSFYDNFEGGLEISNSSV